MDKILLLVSIVLLVLSIKYNMLTHAHALKKIERPWYDRLWTGSRQPRNNLTEEGLKYRRQSNICAMAGFAMLCVYLFARSMPVS